MSLHFVLKIFVDWFQPSREIYYLGNLLVEKSRCNSNFCLRTHNIEIYLLYKTDDDDDEKTGKIKTSLSAK